MKIFLKFFFLSGSAGFALAFFVALIVHTLYPLFSMDSVVSTAVITFFQSGLLCGSLSVMLDWK